MNMKYGPPPEPRPVGAGCAFVRGSAALGALLLIGGSCTLPATEGGSGATVEAAVRVTQSTQGATEDTHDLKRARKKFYAAPDGSPDGNGSLGRPWDLQTALSHPQRVKPGSVILLRGGTYRGAFVSALTGAEGSPITVREHPGERAIIDGAGFAGSPLTINGDWSTFVGFEVTDSSPGRFTEVPGPGTFRDDGITVHGANTKLVNLVVHEHGNGIGFWERARDSEIYGCIVFNNGWAAPDGGHGHGIYIQNREGTKRVVDVIAFNNFQTGMKAFAENGHAVGVTFEGVVSFNNGSPPERGGPFRLPNILVGTSLNPADRIAIVDSHLYHPPLTGGGSLILGYTALGNGDVEVRGCHIVNGGQGVEMKEWKNGSFTGNMVYATSTQVPGANAFIAGVRTAAAARPEDYEWDGNRYFDTTPQQDGKTYPLMFNDAVNVFGGGRLSFAEWRQASGFDRNSSYSVGPPSGVEVVVRVNQYEAGRAHVIVYNWDGARAVDVDVSGVLPEGAGFEVRDAQNLAGAPVLTGTYTGQRLRLPLAEGSAATPTGYDFTPQSTAPEFSVFVLRRRRSS